MQPRPISETSGPSGPSLRLSMARSCRLAVRRRPAEDRPWRPVYQRRARARLSSASSVLQSKVFPVNLPNLLTVLRIMLVPVLVVALLGNTPAGDVLAAVVFALASLTDFIDGYLARTRDSITTFGKLMDPLADKLLIVAALVSLVSLDRLAAWVAMVIISREIAVTGLRTLAAERGVVLSASWLGKVKTALQIAAVFALIVVNPATVWVDVLVYAAVAMTVISGVDYFFGLRGMIDEQRHAAERGGSAPDRDRAVVR